LVLSDEQRTGHHGQGTQSHGEEAFLEKLRMESCRRQEFANAFAKEQEGPSDGDDLRKVQRAQATQLAQLDREIGRLRRSLRIAQWGGGVVGVALLGLAGYLLTQPNIGLDFTATGNSETRALNGREDSGSADPMSELVLASDLEFQIRTDVDRKYQLIIRHLYANVRTIRQPRGSIEERVGATDDYLRFMTDVSRAIEEAAQEQVSSEIMLALSNLALVAQELRKVPRMMDLDIETENKRDQIEAVLRARDTRSLHSESQPAMGRG
jgi:hypothetical protein